MAYSDKKKYVRIVSLSILLFAIISFVHSSSVFADTESVDISSVNLSMSASRNYFTSGSSSVGYFELEKGYIYHITNLNSSFTRLVVISDDLPGVNVTYTVLTNIEPLGTYDYIANNNSIMYISYDYSNQASVTREKISGMDSTVSELVNNVGIDNIWSIFEIAIDYIWVVVLVAFGIFIITRLIKRLSRGKEGM